MAEAPTGAMGADPGPSGLAAALVGAKGAEVVVAAVAAVAVEAGADEGARAETTGRDK